MSVLENENAGAIVGTVKASDDDVTDVLYYYIRGRLVLSRAIADKIVSPIPYNLSKIAHFHLQQNFLATNLLTKVTKPVLLPKFFIFEPFIAD